MISGYGALVATTFKMVNGAEPRVIISANIIIAGAGQPGSAVGLNTMITSIISKIFASQACFKASIQIQSNKIIGEKSGSDLKNIMCLTPGRIDGPTHVSLMAG